jgi:ubiquinone/menaquinone biosynthesis C-methylase UbiE
MWSRRAKDWDHGAAPGVDKVAQAVVAAAGPVDGLVVVDLGAGTGRLTFDLARQGATVTAVDFSQAMLDIIASRAADEGLASVQQVRAPLQDLELPDASVDLIVSNYSLHHLRHTEKRQFAEHAVRWLRPGGRIVIGDMMFGPGRDGRDRQIIASKVSAMVKRGPAGLWRLARNGWRIYVSRQECPLSPKAWSTLLSEAGFIDIRAQAVVAEAAIITASTPPQPVAPQRANGAPVGTPLERKPEL